MDYYAELLVEPGPRAQAFAALIRSADMGLSGLKPLLKALEMAIERRYERLGSGGGLLPVISAELRDVLAGEMEKESSEMDLIELFKDLMRRLRTILSEISQPEITQTFSFMWKIAVLALDKALKLAETRVNFIIKEKQDKIAAEEAKLARIHSINMSQIQAKLTKSAEDAAKQTAKIGRLRGEKERLAGLLRDREDEIRALRRPGNVREWEKMMEEMARYFEEAEGRQETQANLLESISKMLDTSKVKALHPHTHRNSISSHVHFPHRRSSILPSPRYPRPSQQAFFTMMTSEKDITELPLPIYQENVKESSDSEESYELQETGTQTDLTAAQLADMKSFKRLKKEGDIEEILEKVTVPLEPMGAEAVIALLEEAVEEKVRLDIQQEGQNNPYIPFSQVFIAHLFTKFSLYSTFSATLKSFIAGLDLLNDPFRLISSQLLGVLGQESFPRELEAFLSKTWVAMARKEAVSLLEVMEIVGGLMKNMPESAGKVLENCIPRDISLETAVFYLISRKLNKLGRDFKHFFTLMDTEKCGKVTFNAFCETSKRLFGFSLSANMLNRFWASFNTDQLAYSQLISCSNSPLREVQIAPIHTLTALITEYERLKSLKISLLKQLFLGVGTSQTVSLPSFQLFLKQIDASASVYTAIELLERVVNRTKDADMRNNVVNAGDVAAVVMEMRVGEAGKLGFEVSLRECEHAVRRLIERNCRLMQKEAGL